jgi:hypothetical protein
VHGYFHIYGRFQSVYHRVGTTGRRSNVDFSLTFASSSNFHFSLPSHIIAYLICSAVELCGSGRRSTALVGNNLTTAGKRQDCSASPRSMQQPRRRLHFHIPPHRVSCGTSNGPPAAVLLTDTDRAAAAGHRTIVLFPTLRTTSATAKRSALRGDRPVDLELPWACPSVGRRICGE